MIEKNINGSDDGKNDVVVLVVVFRMVRCVNLVDASLGRDVGHLVLVEGVLVDRTVVELDLARLGVLLGEGVLHPIDVIALAEVLAGVSTTRLLAGLGANDSLAGLREEVLELEGLHEV